MDEATVLIDWMQRGLRKPGKSKSGLASSLGRAPSAVTALLKGERALKLSEIPKIEEYLEESFPGRKLVTDVTGNVGANAGPDVVSFFENQDIEYGAAPLPPDPRPGTKAVRVKGGSMRNTAKDGWLVYYDTEEFREPPTPDLYGELCLVWLNDGRILMKTLYPTRADGLYDLESTNDETIRNVAVWRATLVTAIVPRGKRPDTDQLTQEEQAA
jgi:repressor LexA